MINFLRFKVEVTEGGHAQSVRDKVAASTVSSLPHPPTELSHINPVFKNLTICFNESLSPLDGELSLTSIPVSIKEVL